MGALTASTAALARHRRVSPSSYPQIEDCYMGMQQDWPAWQMPPGLPQAADDRWAYVLDDIGVTYGPGWWPFYADRTPAQAPRTAVRTPKPCGVRLAPDVAFYAWHTEYVALYPTKEPGVVDGACHIVPSGTARHHANRVTFRLRQAGDEPEQIGSIQRGEHILAGKIRRAVDFPRAGIAERDGGAERPTTAAEAYRTERDATAQRDDRT